MLSDALKKNGDSNQRIKRPMNAFMVWSQMRRQEISSTGGKFHNSDISKMLGAEWRKMAEEDKLPFVQKARELREEHFREHPDYVYRPRRRKRCQKGSTNEAASSEEQPAETVNRLIPQILFSQWIYNNLLTQIGQTANQQNVLQQAQEPHSPPATTTTLTH